MRQDAKTIAIGTSLLAAAFVAGTVAGSSDAPSAVPGAGSTEALHAAPAPGAQSRASTQTGVREEASRASTEAAATAASPPATEHATEQAAHTHHGDPVAQRKLSEASDEDLIGLFAQADSPAVRSELLARMRDDPSRLVWAVTQFAQETDSARLGAWSRLLGNVKHPGVREVVSGMALDASRSKGSRIAALRVLEQQRSLDTIPAVTQLLADEPDTDVLKAAMYALPNPRGASEDEAAGVVEAILQRASDPRDEVRRVAVAKLADWPQHPAVRPALVQTLQADLDAGVRAAAAFSLIWVGPKDNALLSTLATRVQDPAEDWFVRENAWRALGAEGVLPGELASVYQDFGQERRSRRAAPR